MSLEELYPSISPFTKILIMTKLETGTAESFDIEITRGGRAGGCRKEYYDWLFSLGLEVECLTVCAQDASGNKELLCIHCKPIKLKGKVNKNENQSD